MSKKEMIKEETKELSKSKAKREERKKEVKKEKKQKLISNIIFTVAAAVIIGVFVGAIGFQIYKAATRTTAGTDFSAQLTDEGLIKGANTASDVTLADYKSLVVPKSEADATAEEVDSDIQSLLDSHKELKDDGSIVIAEGDTVHIDYVGTMDGTQFEGGSSNGEGYDLEIGSGTFIDGFEEQLIGHSPKEEITVVTTFPEDYNNADLAGKEAEFAVTIHSVYVTPEFTDEFVKENLADDASTADEYRSLVEEKYYKQHLSDYLYNFIMDNSVINSYPKAYVKNLKSITKSNDEYTMQYYNQMFAQYGVETYKNVWETRGEGIDNEVDYERDLTKRAEDAAAQALIYQAIYEKEGLQINFDELLAEITEQNGEEYAATTKETYGQGYMIQSKMQEVVMNYLMENANVQ